MTQEIGARIVPKEPVKPVDKEGPLDQIFAIEIDDCMNDTVLLDNVRGPDDVFERCPALGEIDLTQDVNGKSIEQHLKDDAYVYQDLVADSTGKELQDLSDVATDRYSVTDASWVEDTDELIWRSALMAQLQAKYLAVTHLLSDPGAVNFGGTLTDSEREAVARRASELSAKLLDDALAELTNSNDDAQQEYEETVAETMSQLGKYIVTRKQDIEAGGLTEAEHRSLFKTGGKR